MTTPRYQARRRRLALSEPERRNLVLYANGYERPKIARIRGVSKETVKTQLTAAYALLGATGQTHAVAIAIRSGIIRPGEIADGRRSPDGGAK